MAAPSPIRESERKIDHFQVKAQVFDRVVGFLGRQPIELCMGLFQDLVKTSSPVFEDELPLQDPHKPGEVKGDGKIVEDVPLADGEDDADDEIADDTGDELPPDFQPGDDEPPILSPEERRMLSDPDRVSGGKVDEKPQESAE